MVLALSFPSSAVKNGDRLSYRQARLDWSSFEVSLKFVIVESTLVISNVYLVLCRKPREFSNQRGVEIIRLDPFLIVAKGELARLQ